jgi:hypothetical protein
VSAAVDGRRGRAPSLAIELDPLAADRGMLRLRSGGRLGDRLMPGRYAGDRQAADEDCGRERRDPDPEAIVHAADVREQP